MGQGSTLVSGFAHKHLLGSISPYNNVILFFSFRHTKIEFYFKIMHACSETSQHIGTNM